ncbi:hypothetical protein Tco_1041917 [Tanacetum coccineum]|uniref:Uncharacterized protein n=1 Tax=Tanacetum coccineum TaxID=301880 RepID=A0ABQ5GJS5_9ASTR
MPSPNYPTPDFEKTFSSNFPDYFPATLENNSPNSLNDFTKYLLDILVFSPLHDDPIVEIMQAYDATDNELPTLPLQTIIALPAIIPSISSSPVGSSAPSPDYLFDESIFAKFTVTHYGYHIATSIGEEPRPQKFNESGCL